MLESVEMKKFISLVASISLLFNSLVAPLTVLAQEVTPSPEPTPIESVSTPIAESTEMPTPTPKETATSEPTEIVTPSPEPTLEATTTPTSQSSPEPTVSLVYEASAELITSTEKVYLTEEQAIVDSANVDWEIDQTSGIAISNENVNWA